MTATLFRHNGVRRKMRPQALHDQLLGGAVRFRHQVEFAFKLERDVALVVVRHQRAGLTRYIDGFLQELHGLAESLTLLPEYI